MAAASATPVISKIDSWHDKDLLHEDALPEIRRAVRLPRMGVAGRLLGEWGALFRSPAAAPAALVISKEDSWDDIGLLHGDALPEMGGCCQIFRNEACAASLPEMGGALPDCQENGGNREFHSSLVLLSVSLQETYLRRGFNKSL